MRQGNCFLWPNNIIVDNGDNVLLVTNQLNLVTISQFSVNNRSVQIIENFWPRALLLTFILISLNPRDLSELSTDIFYERWREFWWFLHIFRHNVVFRSNPRQPSHSFHRRNQEANIQGILTFADVNIDLLLPTHKTYNLFSDKTKSFSLQLYDIYVKSYFLSLRRNCRKLNFLSSRRISWWVRSWLERITPSSMISSLRWRKLQMSSWRLR